MRWRVRVRLPRVQDAQARLHPSARPNGLSLAATAASARTTGFDLLVQVLFTEDQTGPTPHEVGLMYHDDIAGQVDG